MLVALSLKWKHKLGVGCEENATEGCFFQKISGETPTNPPPRRGALHQICCRYNTEVQLGSNFSVSTFAIL
jgi:hypothetical protein